MFNLGMGEITIILMLALIFLGPKKLPELASGLGKLIREIRKTTSDVKNEIQLDEAIRKPFEELREAVTLHPEELKRRDKLRHELADIQRQAEAAVAAAEANISQSPEEAPADQEAGDTSLEASSEAGAPSAPTLGTPDSPVDETLTSITPPPIAAGPAIPGAAPVGTVARTASGRVSGPVGSRPSTPPAPPAPPLAAVLAKGAEAPQVERRVAQPPGGSDFLRSLRAVPEENRSEGSGRIPGRRTLPADPGKFGPSPDSAADRGNTTQALTEADLAAITVGPPPPPPPPQSGQAMKRNLPSPPANAAVAAPPKNPNQ